MLKNTLNMHSQMYYLNLDLFKILQIPYPISLDMKSKNQNATSFKNEYNISNIVLRNLSTRLHIIFTKLVILCNYFPLYVRMLRLGKVK